MHSAKTGVLDVIPLFMLCFVFIYIVESSFYLYGLLRYS